jgi:hypothetical protein
VQQYGNWNANSNDELISWCETPRLQERVRYK